MSKHPNADHVIPDDVDVMDGTVFYGTIEQMEELDGIASSVVTTIEDSDNARLVVIETWLLLDHAVREFLLSGLGLNAVNNEAFDLRYNLLPHSFQRCLDILQRFTQAQSDLPPVPKLVDPRVGISLAFYRFATKERPEDYERFRALEQEFLKKHHPEFAGKNVVVLSPESAHHLLGRPLPEYSRVDRGWLEVAQRLTPDWYKRAKRINEARNKAAHRYDESKIFTLMGFAQPGALAKLKSECRELISTIAGTDSLGST